MLDPVVNRLIFFAATFHLNPQYRITLEDPDGNSVDE